MRLTSLVCAAALLAAFTPAVAQQRATAEEIRVDSLFTAQIRPDGPGCAVGVYRNGKTTLTRGYGLASVEDRRPITPRTAFNLGSASKPFTTLAVLMLEKRGRLSLNDDVRRWIPEMPDYGTPIRIRDLLHHTSGLRDYGALAELSGRDMSGMSEFLGLMASQRDLNFKPGTQHEYSHSDFMLLGLIVERSAGEPFGQHLRRHVLEPLGMTGSFVNDGSTHGSRDRAFGHLVSDAGVRTGFPASQAFGGANLYASVEDLAGWDRNFDDPAVGGRDIIGRMVGRPVLQNGDTIPYAYGLRLGTYRGLRTVSRGGSSGGTRTEIVRFPDHGFTVAVLCNADNLEQWKLAQGVADIYLGSQMQASRTASAGVVPAAVRLTPQQLARYAGMYRPREQPWNLLPVEMRNGVLSEVLFHEDGGDTLIAMTPAGNGRFFEIGLTGNVGVFTFRPETGPSPTILEISWNNGVPEVLERVPRFCSVATVGCDAC